MAKIQTPQHVQELQAEFKVRSQFDLELLETIQPTYSVATNRVASIGYPRKCMGHTGITAGVGDNSECILTCPADVGIIIHIEGVWITDVTGSMTLRADDGVAPAVVIATSTAKAFRDGRIIDQLPDGILQTAEPLSAAPNGAQVALIENLDDSSKWYELDWILGSGAYFLVRRSTANAVLTVAWKWTEYLLEDR